MTGDCILGIHGTVKGIIGVAPKQLSQTEYQEYLLIVFIDIILCFTIFGLVKISILLFYRRVFPVSKFRYYANFALCVVGTFTVAIIFVSNAC